MPVVILNSPHLLHLCRSGLGRITAVEKSSTSTLAQVCLIMMHQMVAPGLIGSPGALVYSS